MTFIGFLGGVYKPEKSSFQKVEFNRINIAKLGFIGFFYTLLFDIITNLIYAVIYYGRNIRLAFITGSFFMIIHLISNTLIFALLIIPTYNTAISLG